MATRLQPYVYYECPRCLDHFGLPRGQSPTVCPRPKCGAKAMGWIKFKIVGEGDLPFPPPSPTRMKALKEEIKLLKDEWQDVLPERTGTDGENVQVRWKVRRNTAQMLVELTISTLPHALVFSSQALPGEGVGENTLVRPVFASARGGEFLAWSCIDVSKLRALAEITEGLPGKIEVRMPLGNAKYGLVHLLHRHQRDSLNPLKELMVRQWQPGPDDGSRALTEEEQRHFLDIPLLCSVFLENFAEGNVSSIWTEGGSQLSFIGKNGMYLLMGHRGEGVYHIITLYSGKRWMSASAKRAWTRP